ncbi:MAG: hypothetical protein P8Z75_12740 [Gammaproteobacteria bacterium]
MRSRLDDLPVFEIRLGTVPAADYNLVQIALKRLGNPLRFELPRLRTLDLILESDAWIVVDRSLNDIPVLAWLDFQTGDRTNLHEPISCERRTYHTHALIIIDKVIEAMHLILGERLNAATDATENQVTQIKRPS